MFLEEHDYEDICLFMLFMVCRMEFMLRKKDNALDPYYQHTTQVYLIRKDFDLTPD